LVIFDTEAQRVQLLQQLAVYVPADALEAEMREQIAAFVKREPRCFERETVEGHCTASAWIVNTDKTATVLVFHKKFNRWVQPGGHADGDGDLRKVAQREAFEETSLASLRLAQEGIFDLHVFDNASLPPDLRHYHFDIRYIFYADQNETPSNNHESRQADWIEFNKLDGSLTDESVLRMMRKIQPST